MYKRRHADLKGGNIFRNDMRRVTSHYHNFGQPSGPKTAEDMHCSRDSDCHDFSPFSSSSTSVTFFLACQCIIIIGAKLSPVAESLTTVATILHRIAPNLDQKKPVYFLYDAACLLFTFVCVRYPGLMSLFRFVWFDVTLHSMSQLIPAFYISSFAFLPIFPPLQAADR